MANFLDMLRNLAHADRAVVAVVAVTVTSVNLTKDSRTAPVVRILD